MKLSYDYLKGVIDATKELNKLAGIDSLTISFGTIETKNATNLTAIWESETKIIVPATYWDEQETKTVLSTEYLNLSQSTAVLDIVNFITACTEQAQKDEYNNL